MHRYLPALLLLCLTGCDNSAPPSSDAANAPAAASANAAPGNSATQAQTGRWVDGKESKVWIELMADGKCKVAFGEMISDATYTVSGTAITFTGVNGDVHKAHFEGNDIVIDRPSMFPGNADYRLIKQ